MVLDIFCWCVCCKEERWISSLGKMFLNVIFCTIILKKRKKTYQVILIYEIFSGSFWDNLEWLFYIKLWCQKKIFFSSNAWHNFAKSKVNYQRHHQLQDTPDAHLATQALIHTCVSTYNKVITSCRMSQILASVVGWCQLLLAYASCILWLMTL